MDKLAEAVVCLSISSLPRISNTGVIFRAEPRCSEGEIILSLETLSGFAKLTFGIDGNLLPEIRSHVPDSIKQDLRGLIESTVFFDSHGPEWIGLHDLDHRRLHKILKQEKVDIFPERMTRDHFLFD